MEFHDFDQLLASREFSSQKAVISIGVFDGLHKGHQSIIFAAHDLAMKAEHTKTVVFTFAQNPKMMLSPSTAKPPLLSMRQIEEEYELLKVDIVVVIDFSPDFSKLSGEQFILRCTQIFDVQAIVVGDNFRCGHHGNTGPEEMKHFLAKSMPHIDVIVPTMYRLSDGNVDSSTIVRATILDGNMGEVPQLLGRYHSLDLGHLPSRVHEWPLQMPKESFMQLLPPPGMYEGHLLMGRSSLTFSGTCCVTEQVLIFTFSEPDQETIQHKVIHEFLRFDSFEFRKEIAQTC